MTGKVTTAQGDTLAGVTVTLDGVRGAQSTITDEDGAFRFTLLQPDACPAHGQRRWTASGTPVNG
ncbi:MAG TPA: carboxypeptidase-like regulatory domain-containing protein [Thermoanaerobaculia bacterium]|nr:carboxypeptidase-like regulatory domain-containing protein [Thermoanaerobaculia bacterium]